MSSPSVASPMLQEGGGLPLLCGVDGVDDRPEWNRVFSKAWAIRWIASSVAMTASRCHSTQHGRV